MSQTSLQAKMFKNGILNNAIQLKKKKQTKNIHFSPTIILEICVSSAKLFQV